MELTISSGEHVLGHGSEPSWPDGLDGLEVRLSDIAKRVEMGG